MSAYSYALSEEAVDAFAHLPAPARRRLLTLFDRLARNPTQPGDFSEIGAAGRTYEMRLADPVMLTWWADHAEREVRIIRIESIG